MLQAEPGAEVWVGRVERAIGIDEVAPRKGLVEWGGRKTLMAGEAQYPCCSAETSHPGRPLSVETGLAEPRIVAELDFGHIEAGFGPRRASFDPRKSALDPSSAAVDNGYDGVGPTHRTVFGQSRAGFVQEWLICSDFALASAKLRPGLANSGDGRGTVRPICGLRPARFRGIWAAGHRG